MNKRNLRKRKRRHFVFVLLIIGSIFLFWCVGMAVYSYQALKNDLVCQHHLGMIRQGLEDYVLENGKAGVPELVQMMDLSANLDSSIFVCPQSEETYQVNWPYLRRSSLEFEDEILLFWDEKPYHREIGMLWFTGEVKHAAIYADGRGRWLTPEDLQEELKNIEKFLSEQRE